MSPSIAASIVVSVAGSIITPGAGSIAGSGAASSAAPGAGSIAGSGAALAIAVLAIAALAGALIALVLARWLRGWRGSWRARRRASRAGAGEGAAAEMLRRAGYRIVAAQHRVWWEPRIDGAPQPTELRADYLVERRGERLIAEVKTGEVAPSLATAATRRQLLEYLVAFDVDGVLLVCPERRAIHRIEFPLAGAALAEDTEAS